MPEQDDCFDYLYNTVLSIFMKGDEITDECFILCFINVVKKDLSTFVVEIWERL